MRLDIIKSLIMLSLGSFSIFGSGCVAHKLHQQDSLVGELFREDALKGVPSDTKKAIKQECALYEELNDINFVLIGEECELGKEKYAQLMQQRWHVVHFYQSQTRLIKEIQTLIKEKCELDAGSGTTMNTSLLSQIDYDQEIAAQLDFFRKSHTVYMEEASTLLKELEPYKESLLSGLITTSRWL